MERVSPQQNHVSSLRVPPQDLEAEKALLGSLMLSKSAIDEIIDYITPESFYNSRHQEIYSVMLELHSKGDPVDLLSLSARLKEKKQLDKIGGASYLSSLIELAPSASNARHYAAIVEKKAALRALIQRAEEILALSYHEEDEIEEIIDKAEKKIFSIKNVSLRQKFISIRESLDEAWERFDKLHKSDRELRGVPTCFPELDAKLAGLQNSDLIILAARPSMGKTSLALDIARKTATQHKNAVGIFSLEMSSQQLVDRMLAAEAHVDSWKLRTGRLANQDEFSRLQHALGKLSEAPIFIDDEPSNSIMKMRALARRLKTENDLKLIIVDYLQLMVPEHHTDSLVQQVTEISRSLKALARELDVPVLALSQLSRAAEQRGGPPRLSDLRQSGSIEQDADVVLFIHRDDKYQDNPEKPNIARIVIAKHRNGPTGEVELFFDEKRVSFNPIEKGDFGEF